MTHEEYQDIAALDAIDAASADEQRALQLHLETCSDCRRVRDEYVEASAALALELPPVAPPDDVRARVLASIRPDQTKRRQETAPMRRRNKRQWWLATAATFFLALWVWREAGLRTVREELRTANSELTALEEKVAQLDRTNDELIANVEDLTAADTRTIALAGQQIAPSASARVHLRPSERRAIVFFHDLPDNPQDKSYQLWIIRADQPKPQSAGVFDVNEDGDASIVISNLPVETEIKGLAVTLEPRGGVEQPTNTNFYLVSPEI